MNSEEQSKSLPSSSHKVISRYVKANEIDLKNLLPSQVDRGMQLQERQENTRSQLATFLIKMLACTLTASFLLIIIVTVMLVFVDEKKTDILKENSTFVKDLVTLILTAQTGLIGTALGFYFGSRGNGSD